MKTSSCLLFTLLITFVGANAAPVSTNTFPPNSAAKVVYGNFVRLLAHRQHQGVGLSWTMLTTQGVAGFVIERSYDGVYFEEVDQVSCSTSGRHRYNDNAVYPGYIHYRIVAIMDDGSTDTSETTVVRIVSRK